MARLIFTDGSDSKDEQIMREKLQRLAINLQSWPPPSSAETLTLLHKQDLADEEKKLLLMAVDDRFETLKREHGYITRDMIVIHENIPDLKGMLSKFEKIHYHSDDEVRYILAGKGYFGFVDSDESQFMLEVSAGDYINVPADTEHWFTMGDSTNIKAVRYFTDTSGWTPIYTNRPLQFALD